MTDLLHELISKCKCGVSIEINNHRNYYYSVKKYLEEFPNDEISDINPRALSIMEKKDTIVEIQFYPDTPISFYKVYHYDLEEALKICLND